MKERWPNSKGSILKGLRLRGLAKPWLGTLLALSILLLLGAFGYRITEGWDWGDSLWMVLITISTIGYGEVAPLSAAGRLVTVLVIGGGLIIVQLTIKRVLDLTASGYFRQMRELRFRRIMRRMHDHVILCGYGRIGQEIADQLLKENVPTLVVEIDPTSKSTAEERGLMALEGDATLDETLLQAGLDRCRSLIAALPNDAANLYVILSAKGLRQECRLIARADTEEASAKLKLAGADVVVSPYVTAGRTIAATALRPLAVDFMDLLAGSGCEIEEFLLTSDPNEFQKLQNKSLSEVQLGRQSGAMVLAIRDGANLVTNPGGNMKLSPGQVLVVLGSKQQLAKLRGLLGKTLCNVETMTS